MQHEPIKAGETAKETHREEERWERDYRDTAGDIEQEMGARRERQRHKRYRKGRGVNRYSRVEGQRDQTMNKRH